MKTGDIKIIEAKNPSFEEQVMLLIESLKKDIRELRVDVDKLIENWR